jgi:hypothetical protein
VDSFSFRRLTLPGFNSFCIVAITLALSLVPLALSRSTAPVRSNAAIRVNPRKLYGQSPFGVVAAFFAGATTSTFFALGPVFAQKRGLDTAGIAAFMSCGTLGGFLMAWPLGWLSDRICDYARIFAAPTTVDLSFLRRRESDTKDLR